MGGSARMQQVTVDRPVDPADGSSGLPLLSDRHYYLADDLPEIPRPLFHGTTADLPVGTVIGPQTKRYAHATFSVQTARVFAGDDAAQPGRVLEVEPVEHELTWLRQMKHTDGEFHFEHLSYGGFRVVGEVDDRVTDADVAARAAELLRQWRQETSASWCAGCAQWHRDGQHRDMSAGGGETERVLRAVTLPAAFDYGLLRSTPARVAREALRQVQAGVLPHPRLAQRYLQEEQLLRSRGQDDVAEMIHRLRTDPRSQLASGEANAWVLLNEHGPVLSAPAASPAGRQVQRVVPTAGSRRDRRAQARKSNKRR